MGINPVTGKTETRVISERQEIQLGNTHYPKLIQVDGGELSIDPTINAYVNAVGQSLCQYSGRAHLDYQFTVVNSGEANAWALPGGKIAITRGLLRNLESEAELAAVLSHEIVHAAGRHWANSKKTSRLLSGLVTGLSFFLPGAASFGASLGKDLYMAHYSRSDESEADLYGMKMMDAAGYDPVGMVRLQKHFLELSKTKTTSFARLFSTHPPTQSRIEDAKEELRNYAAGGRIAKQAYAEAMATLTELEPAYALFDQGEKALKEKDFDLASQVGGQLILHPLRDARFHAFLAKLDLYDGKTATALDKLDTAIEMDDSYYATYYTRGHLYQELGYDDLALKDLERSEALLSTPQTRKALIQIKK